MKSKKSIFLIFNVIFLSMYILSVSFFYNNIYKEEKENFYNQYYEVHQLGRILTHSDESSFSMDDVIKRLAPWIRNILHLLHFTIKKANL